MSTTKVGNPLDQFKLFYEEIINNKPTANRIRRVRQVQANG